MKALLVGFLTFVFIDSSVYGQIGAAKSSPGKRIEDADHGYSFTAPVNWSAEKSEGKCAGVVLANAAETINIVVKPHHSDSLADFFKNESNLAGQGFRQTGNVKELASEMKYVRVSKAANGYDALVDIIFIPFSSRGGAVVMSFTPSESLAEEAMQYMVDLVKSMRYSAPSTTGQTPRDYPSPSASSPNSSYYSLFAGKRYYYENPRSGFQRRVDFCSSGTFEMDEVTSYGITETKGRWTVQERNGTVYLIMTTSEGQSAFAVSRGSRSGYLRVDDFEYSVSAGSCR